MIVDWLAAWPALLAALVVVFVPGLAVASGLRLRGLALWAVAPVVSTALLAGIAIVFGMAHIPWTPLWVAVAVVVAAAVAWLGGRALGPRRRSAPRDGRALWMLAAGLVIGIGFVTGRFILYVHDPAAISASNDAIFHLNALRYILESGSASSLHISGVIGGTGFYPAAWHAFASLVALMTGCAIPVAANMTSLVVSAVIWPIGIAWFAREASGGDRAVAAVAAALSASLWAFPMLMVEWGVLYAFALSVAILPAAVAIVVAAPRWAAGDGPVSGPIRSAVLSGILALAAVGALALAQPSNLLTWGLLCVVFLSWWVGLHLRGASRTGRTAMIVSLLVVWVAFVLVWFVLSRSTSGSHWPPFSGKLEAVLAVLLNGQVTLPPQIGVSILMLIGIGVAIRRRPLRWLATAWLALAVLYVAVASIGNVTVRRFLLGAWYADPYRFAALAPVVVVPLAAIGLVAVATWATVTITTRRDREAALLAGAWSLVAVAALTAVAFAVRPLVQMPEVTEGTTRTESLYTTTDYLSPDERTLLERLPKTTPPDARIIGNPSTGMAFGYMLSGRDVFPRTWQKPGEPWDVLAQGLRDAGTDPRVCAALAAFGSPEFVLDFGPGESSPGRYVMPGFTGFAGVPGFRLVDHQGDASLWRITACGS